MLADSELTRLIQGGESDRVEFTESTTDLDKIRRAICAFANDMPDHRLPGVMFIGIKDDGACAGTNIDDDLLKKIAGLRSDGKTLPFPAMTAVKKQLNGCEVAVIQVEPSDNPPVKVDNRCWIRVGPRRGQASPEEERRLTEKRRWGNLSYDMYQVQGASIDGDLNMKRFEDEYLPNAVSPEVIEENQRDSRDQLQALRLVGPDRVPTVTAILMLGDDPQHWFPGAYIQFVRFDGTEVTDPVKDQIELSGTLPEQLRELDRILKTNISTALDTSGSTHTEQPDYPNAALQELTRNAVIHRNYESSTTPVRVYWFDDKLVIISPGGLYGEVTSESFQDYMTSYRNPTIAEAMKNMGFMQRFGMGIPKARKALDENGNPPPDFNFQDTFISVTVKSR